MKPPFVKLVAGLALSCGLAVGAQAATLNFYAESTPSAGTGGFERGVGNNTVLNTVNTDNVNVTLTSSHFAYFDNGAGLGVCKVLDGNSQCNPANDDNVTAGEWVDIAFDTAQTLSNIVFRAEGHGILSNASTLLFGTNGGSLTQYTFAQLSALSFGGVTSARFAYDDNGNYADQFYLSSAIIEGGGGSGGQIPLPASAPLILGGLGMLGMLRRRKKVS